MRRAIARSSTYEDTDSDDFPTVPWATRAFFKYVAPEFMSGRYYNLSIYDPACGRGHILEACRSIGFKNLYGSDIVQRVRWAKHRSFRYDGTFDYVTRGLPKFRSGRDLLITNPPGKLATKFVARMMYDSSRYVAALCPLSFAEGGREHDRSRWELIYKQHRPTRIAVISARMPAAHGRVVQHRAVFRAHAWFFWDLTRHVPTEFRWIPPEAQRLLERKEDYE